MPEQSVLSLEELRVRPVEQSEEQRRRQLMAADHYLGFLPKIGEALWYAATYHSEWVALLNFSAPAWKCGVRDRWIGWDFGKGKGSSVIFAIFNHCDYFIIHVVGLSPESGFWCRAESRRGRNEVSSVSIPCTL